MRVRTFWHNRIEWYCHHKLLHIRVSWKGFHQDIHKTKRYQSKQQPGTWQWVNPGASRIHVPNQLKWQYSLHIHLSPVLLLNSPSFHSFPCFWENSNLVMLTCTEKCMHIHESSWIIGKIELSQHWSWQKAIKCSCRVKKNQLELIFFSWLHIVWNMFWWKIKQWRSHISCL